MKIVCIDNVKRGGVILPLTIGKVYETDGLQSTLYRIRCDDDVSMVNLVIGGLFLWKSGEKDN